MSPDALYDTSAVLRLVADQLDGAASGTQADLARALRITPTTVNRWARRLTSPPPKYWEGIEAFSGWKTDTIARKAGLKGGPRRPEPEPTPPGGAVGPLTQRIHTDAYDLEVAAADGRQLTRDQLERVKRLFDEIYGADGAP